MQNILLEIEENIGKLREELERLLENSKDESAEKEALSDILEQLHQLFSDTEFANIEMLFQSVKSLVDDLSAFGNGENEALLLRFCLLLEQLVETKHLGVDLPKDYFSTFIHQMSEQELAAEAEDNINHASINVLRMLYQRELISLLRNQSIENALTRLNGVVGDLKSELPISMQSEWRTLDYYLKSLKGSTSIEPITHRILGFLDHKLAAILRYKPLELGFLPELVEEVEKLPRGKAWLQAERDSSRIYISAGVYSRFVDSIRDQIVTLHESVERLYIDKGQVDRLDESIQFLDELDAILNLMGFDKLSGLAGSISLNFQAWCQNDSAVIDSNFHEIVNYVWILEENLNQLWVINDDEIPVTTDGVEGWALDNAYHSLYQQLSIGYEEMHEALQSGKNSLIESQKQFLEYINIENLLNNDHPLLLVANEQLPLIELNQEKLSSLLVTFAYIASRHLSSSSISSSLIEDAMDVLQSGIKKTETTPASNNEIEDIGSIDDIEGAVSLDDEITIETVDEHELEKIQSAEVFEVVAEEEGLNETMDDQITSVMSDDSFSVSFDEESIDDIEGELDEAEFLIGDEKLDKTSSSEIQLEESKERAVENLDKNRLNEVELTQIEDIEEMEFDFDAIEPDAIAEEDGGVGELDESLLMFFDDSDETDDTLEDLELSTDEIALVSKEEVNSKKEMTSKEEPSLLISEDKDFGLELIPNESKSKKDDEELSISFDEPTLMDENNAEPVASKILLTALSEETAELDEVFRENISQSRIGKREIQELLRVAHTLKANVKLIKLNEVFEQLQILENYLLSIGRCTVNEKNVLKNDIEEIFDAIREKIGSELAKFES